MLAKVSYKTQFRQAIGMKIVVSRKAYQQMPLEKLRQAGKSIEHPWTLKESIFVRDEGFTDDIKYCTAGLLRARGGDEAYLFHLHPDNVDNTWQDIENELVAVQQRLRKGNANTILKNFMVGARRKKDVKWPGSANSKTSQLAGRLLHFFNRTDVETSALLIQDSEVVSAFHFSLPKDEITLYANSLELCSKPIETLDGLYARRIIAPNDEIEIRGD